VQTPPLPNWVFRSDSHARDRQSRQKYADTVTL
jgi:hypothetical protein